ncbi:MAG: lipase family protein [Eubacteriales bacterium]|nr:lipase family protein [Eubacteriales bacterium]
MNKKIFAYILIITISIIITLKVQYHSTYTVKQEATYIISECNSIIANGNYIKDPPIIKSDVVYLPIVEICEKLNYTVARYSHTININNKDERIQLNTKDNIATIKRKGYKSNAKIHLTSINNEPSDGYISKDDAEKIFQWKIQFIQSESTLYISTQTQNKHYITFDDGMGPITLGFYYDDSFFLGDNDKYSPQLAELCIALSSGAYTKSAIATAFKEMGYKYTQYHYNRINKMGSAFSLGTKTIDGVGKVYIIAIRGTCNGEWESNFDIYKNETTPSKVHYGFEQGKNKIMKILDRQIQDKDDGIYLITGHSRGGAIANLLATELTNKGAKVYGYTFASPNVSTNADTSMKNIFNFCNESDFITKLPFNGKDINPAEEEWIYSKNGETINFDVSDAKQPITEEMESEFNLLTQSNFCRIDSGELQKSFDSISKVIPTVKDYYGKKISVGRDKMSVYEYFIKGLCAAQKSGPEGEEGMSIIAKGLIIGDMARISRFLAYNATETIREDNNNTGYGVKHNHSCAVYYSWVKAYNKYN